MILVTGGTGLVGSHLLYKLASQNEKIRAIFRTEDKLEIVKKVFSYYSTAFETLFNAIEWIKADLLDVPEMDAAFKDITHVYHCAALVSFEPAKYTTLRRINIEGTANVVNLCLSNHVEKLCYVSSVATIGKSLTTTPVNEETLWNPEDDHNVYAITKYGAEIEVWRGIQEGLNAVIVNPGVILGSGFWQEGSGSLFNRVYKKSPFVTNGVTGFVDVEDVVNIMTLLMQGDYLNERYILVAENWSYKQLLQTIAKNLDIKIPKKEVKSWQAELGWRIDWFLHKTIGKRRLVSKQLAKTINSKTLYNTKKVSEALNYSWTPIETSIAKTAKQFKAEL